MNDRPDQPRILVVEDDPDQRDLLCEALVMHYGPGMRERIVDVGTGAECLAREPARFDVVLLDYILPDVAGIDLLERILAVADVPVIFVTGQQDAALAAEAIARGAQDYIVKLGDYLFAVPVVVKKSIRQHHIRLENERLRMQLELMLDELKLKNAQLEESLGRLRTMAATDHLTALANRRHFSTQLEQQYSRAVRYGHDLTCCMCDLDNYKQLNDSLGHQVGDRVLVITAEVIRSMLRLSDTAARYGGDEFVLLLPETDCLQALAAGQRLRERLVDRLACSGPLAGSVTLSMGIASLRRDEPATADALVSMADRALYAAKAAGRDRIVLLSDLAEAPTPGP
jgi:diguanylate cyclase (GGDEF)-like protein